jgi:hypothetical protein
MQNQQEPQQWINDDQEDEADSRVNMHQNIGSKRLQEEFDTKVDTLFERISSITDQVIELNRTLNQRNNTLVQDVSSIIHEVLHDTSEVANELNIIKDKKD